MSGLSGNLESLRAFSKSLRRVPVVVAHKVATASAPAITSAATATFEASANAYGVSWLPGADGRRITLKKSGALAKFIRYVAIGSKLRVSLGVPYAKFQIGRRPIFPPQGAPLPAAYVRTLQQTASDVIRAELGRP